MSAQTEDDWREAFGVDADDLDAEGWADLWERHDGDVDEIASYVGISFPETLRELAAAGVYPHDEWSTHYVERLVPEDFGLDPLNCTRCGELAISDHECPSCGYDPRDVDGQMCEVCGRRYATLTTDLGRFCDECHETGEREWTSPIDGADYVVTAWRDIAGRFVPLQREEVDDD